MRYVRSLYNLKTKKKYKFKIIKKNIKNINFKYMLWVPLDSYYLLSYYIPCVCYLLILLLLFLIIISSLSHGHIPIRMQPC